MRISVPIISVFLAALGVALVPARAQADMLTWEYSGTITSSSAPYFRLSELYPAGTAFSFTTTIATSSASAGGGCQAPQGLYQPIGNSSLTIGGNIFTSSGGWAAVNHHFDVGCVASSSANPYGELWLFEPWAGPPLSPEFPQAGLGLVQATSFDPMWTSGMIPTTPPPVLAFAFGFTLGGAPFTTFANGRATRLDALPVIPEPTTLLLFGTGLTGCGVARRKKLMERFRG